MHRGRLIFGRNGYQSAIHRKRPVNPIFPCVVGVVMLVSDEPTTIDGGAVADAD
jgi:hypothetical protein